MTGANAYVQDNGQQSAMSHDLSHRASHTYGGLYGATDHEPHCLHTAHMHRQPVLLA